MGWWGDNVPEETLSRDEATRVVRRLMRMLKPWRGLIIVATFVLAPVLFAARPEATEQRSRCEDYDDCRRFTRNVHKGRRDRRPRARGLPGVEETHVPEVILEVMGEFMRQHKCQAVLAPRRLPVADIQDPF